MTNGKQLTRLNSFARSFWRRHRCGGRILTVVVADECLSNVEPVSRIENTLHLAAIQDHRDAAGLGERIQSFADFVLQRTKQFLTTFLVSRLSILSFALALFFELIQLINLGLNCLWRDRSPLRGLLLQVGDLVRELLDLQCHVVKFLLPSGELAIQFSQGCVEPRDTRFRILKRLRKDYRNLADRHGRRGLRERRSLRPWLGAGTLRDSRGDGDGRDESEGRQETISVPD